MNQGLLEAQATAENWSAGELLAWAAQEFGVGAAMASSFGAEDVVLIDIASRIGNPFPVFTLDTDFLFPESYDLIARVETNYGIKVERLRPKLSPEEQSREFGAALWAREPDRCCAIRKVEPLTERLKSSSAWITGIRREQSPTRATARKLEWDAKFDLVKLNPLADWREAQIWEYIRSHEVPYNPLHDRRYPSIGCTHCTRAVLPGEDPRSGRWSGLAKTECGLHVIQTSEGERLVRAGAEVGTRP
ncbi:MAG TPA: phosphoadenylyl-sulfate reductase [Terriglobales bacterium]|nr:phosphoadenylyl-sulfate reductase [Terriglobales bacterium]